MLDTLTVSPLRLWSRLLHMCVLQALWEPDISTCWVMMGKQDFEKLKTQNDLDTVGFHQLGLLGPQQPFLGRTLFLKWYTGTEALGHESNPWALVKPSFKKKINVHSWVLDCQAKWAYQCHKIDCWVCVFNNIFEQGTSLVFDMLVYTKGILNARAHAWW